MNLTTYLIDIPQCSYLVYSVDLLGRNIVSVFIVRRFDHNVAIGKCVAQMRDES